MTQGGGGVVQIGTSGDPAIGKTENATFGEQGELESTYEYGCTVRWRTQF